MQCVSFLYFEYVSNNERESILMNVSNNLKLISSEYYIICTVVMQFVRWIIHVILIFNYHSFFSGAHTRSSTKGQVRETNITAQNTTDALVSRTILSIQAQYSTLAYCN